MNRIIPFFLASLFIPSGCAAPAPELPLHQQEQAVIAGEAELSTLGVEFSSLEQNTVVAQHSMFFTGIKQLGCTGTVVGDRVVVVAGHCLIDNMQKWQAGADPVIASPHTIEYAVGPDASSPLCSLEVESVHLHPGLDHDPVTLVKHDLGIAILKASVIETCPHLVPAQINNDDLTDDFIGKALVQGGYGSLDGSYALSPKRYWALVELAEKNDAMFIIHPMEKGFPTNGDSGAGALLRFSDGSLRNLGVVSSGGDEWRAFPRLDSEAEFLGSVLDSKVLCGNVDNKGTCVGDTVVTCDAQGFFSDDCAKKGSNCVVNEAGQASCDCPCGQGPSCNKICDCDADCPCECDITSDCEADCSCDGDCSLAPPDGGAPDIGVADGGKQSSNGGDVDGGGGCAVGSGVHLALMPWLILLLLLILLSRRRFSR